MLQSSNAITNSKIRMEVFHELPSIIAFLEKETNDLIEDYII